MRNKSDAQWGAPRFCPETAAFRDACQRSKLRTGKFLLLFQVTTNYYEQ